MLLIFFLSLSTEEVLFIYILFELDIIYNVHLISIRVLNLKVMG